jgi:hypothetical protein
MTGLWGGGSRTWPGWLCHDRLPDISYPGAELAITNAVKGIGQAISDDASIRMNSKRSLADLPLDEAIRAGKVMKRL